MNSRGHTRASRADYTALTCSRFRNTRVPLFRNIREIRRSFVRRRIRSRHLSPSFCFFRIERADRIQLDTDVLVTLQG